MAKESESSSPQKETQVGFSPKLSSLKDRSCPDQVCRLTTSHYREAANTLAEAFAVDEVVRYLVDTHDRVHWSEEEKWSLHVSILEYFTYAHAMRGLVTTVGEDFGCIALWIPPNATIDSLLTFLLSGIWRLYYKLSREGRARFFREFCPLLHDTKHEVLGPAHDPQSYYLVYVGTKPSARGKGYARRLIQATTACADAEGVPCYLESSNIANLKLYGRLGFEVRKRIWLERAEKRIPLDIMVREPHDISGDATTEKPATAEQAMASPPSANNIVVTSAHPTPKASRDARPTAQLKLNLSSPAVLLSSSTNPSIAANVANSAFPESKSLLAAAASTGVTGGKITAYAVAKTAKEDVSAHSTGAAIWI